MLNRAGVVLLSVCTWVFSAAGDARGDTRGAWQHSRTVAGVEVEALRTGSGFDRHRGTVAVCTDLPQLRQFVTDPERLHEWVPYTEDARLIERFETRVVYYQRSSAPWPLWSRDMIYELALGPGYDDRQFVLVITGLPERLPESDDAVRMQNVDGEWRISVTDDAIRVQLDLYVNPGRVPRFFANRRLATTVGRTLANLAGQFPCSDSNG